MLAVAENNILKKLIQSCAFFHIDYFLALVYNVAFLLRTGWFGLCMLWFVANQSMGKHIWNQDF